MRLGRSYRPTEAIADAPARGASFLPNLTGKPLPRRRRMGWRIRSGHHAEPMPRDHWFGRFGSHIPKTRGGETVFRVATMGNTHEIAMSGCGTITRVAA